MDGCGHSEGVVVGEELDVGGAEREDAPVDGAAVHVQELAVGAEGAGHVDVTDDIEGVGGVGLAAETQVGAGGQVDYVGCGSDELAGDWRIDHTVGTEVAAEVDVTRDVHVPEEGPSLGAHGQDVARADLEGDVARRSHVDARGDGASEGERGERV